jgi:hypothetical protein
MNHELAFLSLCAILLGGWIIWHYWPQSRSYKANGMNIPKDPYNYRGYQYINTQTDQYPAYYINEYSPMNNDAEKCITLPKVKAMCINRKLMETGGDMAQSIRECRANGRVIEGCKEKKCKNEYYPYIPQYVTMKKKVAYPVRTAINAPTPVVKFIPDDYDNDFFEGATKLSEY